ncbi:EI24 domain-containing protein [Plebeiibacterium marinum]|uniref:EI24 domain-containing protein n=1 Tax=Plebeiibacterium marinum TaxID=2992111 RepID=A0AAE3MBY3_9BACT|nr:EI24 domain-containing protein [Plebeiobacterium marinum]MCW3804941.1 EI24 domain-containing protein [Plebeiobacterium marinum]
MTFFQGLQLGFNSYSKAINFIKKHKLGCFFIFPLLLNIILFSLGYASTVSLSTKCFVYLTDWVNMDSWDFWGSNFISSVLFVFMNIVIRLLFVIIFAYIGGYIVIMLLSPVFAYLSETVEKIITGNEFPFDFKQFLKDIWRGIRLATRNFLIEMMFTILFLIIGFIPIVGLFSSLALFAISSYFYGFSFIDFSLERKKADIKESIAFVKTHKGLAIGTGSVFGIVLMIPYIGVLLSGFISIISIVASTIATTESINHEKTINLN